MQDSDMLRYIMNGKRGRGEREREECIELYIIIYRIHIIIHNYYILYLKYKNISKNCICYSSNKFYLILVNEIIINIKKT